MKALVLAGGYPQIELINELKERSIETVLVDMNEEPVAKAYADKFYQISTLDIKAVHDLAVSENVDFLITVCTDQALLTVAKVSEDIGLPCYIDYQTALNVTNKAYMKENFKKNNIPTTNYVILNEFDEQAIGLLKYPLIVKPVDCNSSKGVRKAENLMELIKFYEDAHEMSRSGYVIIEEYFKGYELSADVYVENGEAKLLTLSNSQKIACEDKFVIFRAVYPPPVKEELYAEVEQVAQKIADAFHIANSPMLIQILFDGEKVNVIEFSARTGGGVKYLLIENVCGFNTIQAVIELTLGRKPHYERRDRYNGYIVNDFIYCKPGVFDHLEGFQELKEQGVIKDYYQFKWKNAKCTSINNSGDRIGGYTVISRNVSELVHKHKTVRNSIKVIDSEGKDIARHDLLTDLRIDNNILAWG